MAVEFNLQIHFEDRQFESQKLNKKMLETINDGIVTKPTGSDDILTKSQVAEWLQVTERTVEKWVSDGSLPAFRFGRSVRFFREAILKTIREQCK